MNICLHLQPLRSCVSTERILPCWPSLPFSRCCFLRLLLSHRYVPVVTDELLGQPDLCDPGNRHNGPLQIQMFWSRSWYVNSISAIGCQDPISDLASADKGGSTRCFWGSERFVPSNCLMLAHLSGAICLKHSATLDSTFSFKAAPV